MARKLVAVKTWVVERDDGSLAGPFRTAKEAADWMRWDDPKTGARPDLNGKIRPVVEPTTD